MLHKGQPPTLEFKLLGPLEARVDGAAVPVRGERERAMLAMLLLAEGGIVTVDRLVEAVWDDEPPAGAVKAIRNCASALRRRPAVTGPAIPIQATPGGYRLPLDGISVDTRNYLELVELGRQLAAAGRTRPAVATLRTALRLWRGPALIGAGSRVVQGCAARLDEQRLLAWEDCLELELSLGQHSRAVAELLDLAGDHPLRERIIGLLMLALYRCGRQAEALDVYRRLAGRLAGDLGIDPAPATTRLYEAILRQDASLDVPPPPDCPVPASGSAAWRLG